MRPSSDLAQHLFDTAVAMNRAASGRLGAAHPVTSRTDQPATAPVPAPRCAMCGVSVRPGERWCSKSCYRMDEGPLPGEDEPESPEAA